MAAAGEYRTPFTWGKRTAGARDGFGGRADTYPSQGTLWGALDDVSGGRAVVKGSDRAEVTASVRLRNYPAVAAGDRLTDDLGDVWTVEHVARGNNELVAAVARPRTTPTGGTV